MPLRRRRRRRQLGIQNMRWDDVASGVRDDERYAVLSLLLVVARFDWTGFRLSASSVLNTARLVGQSLQLRQMTRGDGRRNRIVLFGCAEFLDCFPIVFSRSNKGF